MTLARSTEAPIRRKAPAWLFAIRNQPVLALSALVLVILALWVFLPGLFTSYNPTLGIAEDRFLPPGAAHWFGTDYLGRDVFAREVHGAGNTMRGAAIAVVIGLFGGTLLGLIAATAGQLVDALVMRVVDVLLAIPGLLLAMCIVASVGPGTVAIAVGIGISVTAPFARLMRAEVLRVRESEFVEAAAISGSRYWRTLFAHILPNSVSAVLSLAAIEFGVAILAIAALGFLGYGAPPPTPEWGTMIAEGRSYLGTAWWLTTLPGVIVIIVVLSLNRVSRAIVARARL